MAKHVRPHLSCRPVVMRTAAVVLAALSILLARSLRGTVQRDQVMISNHTALPLTALYLSPHTAPSWEGNLIPGERLEDGKFVEIHFPAGTAPRTWDIRFEARSQAWEWRELPIQDIESVTLRLYGATGVAFLTPRPGARSR